MRCVVWGGGIDGEAESTLSLSLCITHKKHCTHSRANMHINKTGELSTKEQMVGRAKDKKTLYDVGAIGKVR